MYDIVIEPSRRLLRMKITGFWSGETMASFAPEVVAAVKKLGCEPSEHLVLCDVSEAFIQPQEMVIAFQQLIVHAPNPARRIALYTDTPLARMQSKRVVTVRDGVAVFATKAEAEQWLFADYAFA